jgi:predicted nucleic acid-binding protein
MSTTLLDADVLIDVLEERPSWFDWSSKHIAEIAVSGELVINQIIYAEVSTPYGPQAAYDELLNLPWLKREDLPWHAAYLAAQAHGRYRESGGSKVVTLPDFFIGAHAAVKGYRLLTRDGARIRTYFPSVEVIAPDTHP